MENIIEKIENLARGGNRKELLETITEASSVLLRIKAESELRQYLNGEREAVEWDEKDKVLLMFNCIVPKQESGDGIYPETSLASFYAVALSIRYIGKGIEALAHVAPGAIAKEVAKKMSDFEATLLLSLYLHDLATIEEEKQGAKPAHSVKVRVFDADGNEIEGADKAEIIQGLEEALDHLKGAK